MKAFPLEYQWGEEFKGNNGMDLRDYFAAKAIQAMITHEYFEFSLHHYAMSSKAAYAIADAMMKAREQ